MKKIDLKTSEFKVRSNYSGTASLVFGVLLLAITGLAYGWLYWQQNTTVSKTKSINEKITAKQKELDKPEFSQVYDFESRLFDLKNQMAIYSNPAGSLVKIAQLTFPQNYFTQISIKSNSNIDSYQATLIAPDFETVAKQIQAYQSLAEVQNIMVEKNSSYGENKVSSSLVFDFVKSAGQKETKK